MKNTYIRLILLLIVPVALFSCGDDDEDVSAPKPKGYFRISFPAKKYQKYDTLCPFTFDYPVYAQIVPDKDKNAEPCWMNLDFPRFNATVHLSYKSVNGNVGKYLEDSRSLAVKHTIKADAIEEQPVIRDSSKVYGLIYEIEGNAASSVQFYLTDSTKHFLRGALYFNSRPNKDSLGIVIDFIRDDIHHMIQTFEWKE
jgi:gliding motility-associated lipoprotein GldD